MSKLAAAGPYLAVAAIAAALGGIFLTKREPDGERGGACRTVYYDPKSDFGPIGVTQLAKQESIFCFFA